MCASWCDFFVICIIISIVQKIHLNEIRNAILDSLAYTRKML